MARIENINFYREKKKKRINSDSVKEVFSWIFGIGTAIFLAAVLSYFWGMSTNVVGVSMEPSLYNGQRILIDRFSYLLFSPREGDVVLFLPNGNRNSHYYVRRVVAVPGDRVQIEDGALYVNGEMSEWVSRLIADGGIAENELVLEKDTYFCIGDNPGSSEDSRSANIGPVDRSDLVGRVWFRFPQKNVGMGFVR